MMDFIKVRVKFDESFKDGNIFDGRTFKVGEVVDMSERDAFKIQQSGGYITILDKVIPNPRKVVEPAEETKVEPVEALPEVKRKAGRPKKNAQ